MDRYQSTVRRRVEISGIGLHSGKEARLEILPAKADTGIRFQRTDKDEAAMIAAHPHNVSNTELCTTLGEGHNKVATIEHLMAAFAGLGIDNAIVRVDAPEVPILDGSSAPFVDKILEAGIAKLSAFRRFFVVTKKLEVRDGDRWIRIEPSKRQEISCRIDYGKASVIGQQTLDFTFSRSAFLNLCESRTFCHLKEVNAMRAAGLARGGSLDNAIVVNDTEIMNAEGLRSHDEFVRHKILDCIGDLALLGAPLMGRLTLHKPGHGMHVQALKALLERKDEVLTVVEMGGKTHKDEALKNAVVRPASALYG